ncbi:hypothetical protein XCR_1448 [Xanthomonas campestris pv. raphani 756C]|nr:hypothetical protein XCR_1448 [Xanthomonas campestris pv. raphani 756C]
MRDGSIIKTSWRFFYFADSGVTDALLNWLGERFSKLLSVTFSKVFRVAFFRLS